MSPPGDPPIPGQAGMDIARQVDPDMQAPEPPMPTDPAIAPAPGLASATTEPVPSASEPTASHALLGRLLASTRKTQVGRMVDRYQKPTVSTAVNRLHQDLKGLAQEGEPGRMWYEKSSKRILDYVQGNKDEAHKIAQLIAIYSPQTGVPTNTANAIKAYNRAKSGQAMWAGDIVDRDRSFDTIKGASDYAQSLGKNITKVPLDDSGKRFLFARHNMKGYENIATADRDLKAHLLMNEGIPFEGRKTNNFYRNLMVHIDPTIDQGSTQDLWMARAFGFHDDAVSNATKYDFMEKLTHKLGKELGWKPHQVQAAIWTAMKTRQEAVKDDVMKEAVDKGMASMVPGDKGKPKFQLNEGQDDAYSSLMRDRALEKVLDADHIKRSARDFSDFLDANLAHVSWEATPSRSVGHLKGLSDLAPHIRADYHKRISEALQDEQGNDLLAQHLGMLSPGTVEAPGYWQGDVNPVSHLQVATTRIKAAGQRPDIDTASQELMDHYANARGLLLKQDGVGYHRPFFNPQVSKANGVEYRFDKDLSADEIKRLGAHIDQIPDTALIPSGPGKMRIIHLGSEDPKNPDGDRIPLDKHQSWHKAVDAALQKANSGASTVRARLFASDGKLRGNDWTENPNGEDYTRRLSAAGRSDVLRLVSDVLAPKVEAVDKAFAKEHGLSRDDRLEKSIRSAGSQEGVDLLRGLGRPRKADGGPVNGDDSMPQVPPPTGPPAPPSYIKPGDEDRRQLSPTGLYSHAADVVWKSPQMKGSPQQFKAMLTKAGVKPDEFKWSGYDQAFAGKDMVSKREVRDHFVRNLPKIQETVKTQGDARSHARPGQWSDDDDQDETKYSDYQLPGGKNYREVVLHLPQGQKTSQRMTEIENHLRGLQGGGSGEERDALRLEYRDLAAKARTEGYQSSHWDELNPLLHLRMSDRKGPKGEKILHLEELQSDWGQAAREKGVKTGDALKAYEDWHADARKRARAQLDNEIHPVDKTKLSPKQIEFFMRSMGGDRALGHDTLATYLNEKEHADKLWKAQYDEQGQVPNAPFIDSTAKWTDLGLKRALHEAAKGGYDKVVVTPGEEQAKRYDLSKHVDKVNLVPDASGKFRIDAFKDNNRVMEHYADDEQGVAAAVGKDVAKKLFESRNQHGASTLAGQDLKIGGEGMKGYYDTIVPKALEKLARQHDPEARVHLHGHTLPIGAWEKERKPGAPKYEREGMKVHALAITPKMRASILAGQKGYAAGGRINERLHDDIYQKVRKVVPVTGRYAAGGALSKPEKKPDESVQRGPSTFDEARRWLWQMPEDRWGVEGPKSADPWDEPLKRN